jgi:putative FmdB family regulatory protein
MWIRARGTLGVMPVYEFRCATCGKDVEVVRPMGETDPPGPCPECGGRLRRRWSRVGVRFEGWGFSSTDDLLPEDRRAKRDFKELKHKADEIAES